MIVLIILGIIAAIITVIMLIPVGADVAYESGELRISAKIARQLIQLVPGFREKKGGKSEKQPKKPPEQEKEKKAPKEKKKLNFNFTFDEIMELVKKVLGSFGKFGKKFKVDRFLLDYVAAGRDPYRTTVIFGDVNAALNILAPVCSQRFTVKELSVHTDIDYNTDRMKLDVGLALTVRIGAIFHMINTIAFGALGILIKNKIRLAKEKRQEKNRPEMPDGAAENLN